MQRRDFLHNAALALGAVSLSSSSWLRKLLEEPWKISMLRNDVGIFTEKGGTIAFLLSKQGIAVVDSQFPEQAGHLLQELKNRSQQPFELLINTHHHGDHSGGNIVFKGLAKTVVAHANSRINQESQAKAANKEAAQLYPDQTYSDKWCRAIGKENICLHYFGPAHTNGDSLVHFEHANIVHMGDVLNNKSYPYIDKAAGASIENWILVLDKAYNVFDRKTIFVCGHSGQPGAVTVKRSFLREQKLFFENIRYFVDKEIKAGKTREEVVATPVIPGNEEWQDPRQFSKFHLGLAYDELTAYK